MSLSITTHDLQNCLKARLGEHDYRQVQDHVVIQSSVVYSRHLDQDL
jgi:hypothetical protein